MSVGMIPAPHKPVMEDVFCPYVGWTISRDGFCYDCGATDHAVKEEASTMNIREIDDVRECGGCEDEENHPHAFDCERA